MQYFKKFLHASYIQQALQYLIKKIRNVYSRRKNICKQIHKRQKHKKIKTNIIHKNGVKRSIIEGSHSDILSTPRRWRLPLLLCFSLHRSGRFCGNPLTSFGVSPVQRVAPLGVSVLPLHASLSTCNRDTPLVLPFFRIVRRRRSQPQGEVLSEQSASENFCATTYFTRKQCLCTKSCFKGRNINFSHFIHIASSVAFVLKLFVKITRMQCFCLGRVKERSKQWQKFRIDPGSHTYLLTISINDKL